MWAQVVTGERIQLTDQAMFQIACSGAVTACMEAMGMLGAAAGTTSNMEGSRFNRCLRDAPVVGTHLTVAQEHVEDGGRVLLGIPPTGLMLKGLAR